MGLANCTGICNDRKANARPGLTRPCCCIVKRYKRRGPLYAPCWFRHDETRSDSCAKYILLEGQRVLYASFRFILHFVMCFSQDLGDIDPDLQYSRVSTGCGITMAGTTKTSSASTSGWVTVVLRCAFLRCFGVFLFHPPCVVRAEDILLGCSSERQTCHQEKEGDRKTRGCTPTQLQQATKPEFSTDWCSRSSPPQLPDLVEIFNSGEVVLRLLQRGAMEMQGDILGSSWLPTTAFLAYAFLTPSWAAVWSL